MKKNKILSRRNFVQSIAVASASVPMLSYSKQLTAFPLTNEIISAGSFKSDFLYLEFLKDRPGFSVLSVDSLGTKKLGTNPMQASTTSEKKYDIKETSNKIEYKETSKNNFSWSFEMTDKTIKIQSIFSVQATPEPLMLRFDPKICHVTMLGIMKANEQKVLLPALMHFPDMGTFRITSASAHKVSLGYDASRYAVKPYVEVTFEPATQQNPKVEYLWEVTSIYPQIPETRGDARFNGFRRNFLNIFQLNPYYKSLANHAASDVVAFTIQEYAKVALHTPPLAPGVTAMDILGQTLEQYLRGMKGYGMAGYVDSMPGANPDPQAHETLDTYPALLITSSYYFKGTQDKKWLEKNYPVIKTWAKKMLDMDVDNDGLLESTLSGNANSYSATSMRTSNWWDVVGFGYKDAYSNILAYHALVELSELVGQIGKNEDVKNYKEKAQKLYDKFYNTFYNPATGVLGGWVSKDGKLHDYYFTFLNSMAIFYDLVTKEQANKIMDKMLLKMKEVGFTNFELGLPGNLIPIKKEDYVPCGIRWGAPQKEDGSDAFQIYENGGATACYVYYTIEALYKLNKKTEADKILFSILKSYEEGKFQGTGYNGMTNDWKKWDGTPQGYEGLLVDGYLGLLSVLTMKK